MARGTSNYPPVLGRDDDGRDGHSPIAPTETAPAAIAERPPASAEATQAQPGAEAKKPLIARVRGLALLRPERWANDAKRVRSWAAVDARTWGRRATTPLGMLIVAGVVLVALLGYILGGALARLGEIAAKGI